jgi:hypothetical protein
MAAGLAAGLLAGCTSATTSKGSPHQGTDPATAPSLGQVVSTNDAARSYRQNRRAAAKESVAVVGLVPVPSGSTRLSSPPKSWAGGPDVTVGPSDYTLTRTAWWTVAGDATTIQHWLTSHRPPGLRQEDGVGGGSDGIRVMDYLQPASPDPKAYTPVTLQVMWGPSKTQDGRLIVRADTFIAARARRDLRSYVSGHVASVDIRQVRTLRDGTTRRMPEVRLTHRNDRPAIRRLVKAVNRLDASIRPSFAAPCPAPMHSLPHVAITILLGPHGTQRLDLGLTDWCFGQVQTTRDGRPVRPTLDPGDLVTTVDHLKSG